MTDRRDARSGRDLLVLFAIATTYAALAVAGIVLTREEGRIAAVWLPNAFLLAALLRPGARRDLDIFAAGFVANMAANAIVGDSGLHALMLSSANSVEVAVACFGTRRLCGRDFDVTRLKALARFMLAAGVVAPAISATFPALTLAPAGTAFASDIWLGWFVADGLGLLFATPSLLIAVRCWRTRGPIGRGRALEWAFLIATGTAVTALVFSQTRFPFLFFVSPVVLVCAFRLGAAGTAVSTAIIAIVASVATSMDVGPIHLVRGDLATKLMVLQAFLVVSFLMGIPVAAALEGRYRDRDELARHREMSRSMLENMREVVFRTDAKGRWIFLNPAWEQLTGYTVEQSLGWPTIRLLHPDDFAEALVTYPQLVSGELDECLLKQRFTTAAGAIRNIEVSVRALRGRTGRFKGTIGNLRDVTDRESSLAALAEREAQLALLADNATDAIFRLKLDGECLYASPSTRDLLGVEPSHLVGANMLTRFHPDDHERVVAAHRQLAAGTVERMIVTYRTQPFYGMVEWVWLEANCGLVRDPETARPREIIASIRDISDRKALEFALDAARAHAEAAGAAKSTFLANMSHEIRTPMTGVIGFTDLLLGGTLSDEQRRHAQMIADSGRSLMRLLNDILDISKVEAGQMRIVPEPFDPRHALASSLRLVAPVAEQKGVATRLAIADDVPQALKGDSLRVRQVVLNLLSNAVKFTDAGEVSLETRVAADPNGDRLEIVVADTGIGIPADRLDAILKPFQQADDSTARRFGGTGLGLAISERLVRLMGGDMAVTSVVGEGTRFVVRLPLVAAAALPDARPLAEHAPRAGANVGARILVAEDHDLNQVLMRTLIERLHHHVDIAVDGAEAVAKVVTAAAAGTPYDLVLMDMQMPRVDGVEAARLIRARGIDGSTLPIVALTANAFAEDVDACLAAGMQAHLSKPIDLDALGAALARFLPARRRPAIAAEPTSDDGLRPGLHERYASRRAHALQAMSKMVRQETLEAASVDELATMLHQLAGVCAMFGEAGLGEDCRHLETVLRTSRACEHRKHIETFLGGRHYRTA